ncbi:hypothetical protein L6452_18563 [Arctium lappa]|uniref:Uncharacterized protein n=1 Tax=Arctium lappa TaxID=4217 RepID=A0ACB9C6K6_ARCLA|nr:hypothetical protein L6452_18563 [Arctium lappa]
MNSPSSCNHSFIAPSIDHHLLQLIPSSSTPSSSPSIDSISLRIVRGFAFAHLEAKAKAGLKVQIEKLQLERDEFQRTERLNQVMVEKKKECRSGMEIMNLLQKEGQQRGTWNGKKADNDFYKKIVDAYEAKNQDLVAENADLRALLRSMHTMIKLTVKVVMVLNTNSRKVLDEMSQRDLRALNS